MKVLTQVKSKNVAWEPTYKNRYPQKKAPLQQVERGHPKNRFYSSTIRLQSSS
jgi:hypothetical protein